ncbi:MAG: hypothetical protein B6242_07980 [Anaerolineaceae bacterium 4572_78]|nr:MAG: hypothetical protein B6242_07980 [Anaerolineaceae bacterium 4572_78]
MSRRWVLNASPVIILAKINHAWLFKKLADEVIMPQAVAEEINVGPPHDNAVSLLKKGYFQIIDEFNILPEIIAWDLGKGETAVLSYVYANPKWTAILDDGLARKCAKSFLLSVKGTLGIVLLAKKHGIIPSASDVLHGLKQVDYRIDDKVIEKALWKTVGEAWKS